MKTVEKFAELYYKLRPEGFGDPMRDCEFGFRQGIDTAARIVESASRYFKDEDVRKALEILSDTIRETPDEPDPTIDNSST